jgi:hypothetical protein
MYQIKCDKYILYDPRDEDLIVNNAKCKLEVNTVGEASFTMYASHPYYSKLRKLRSVFEILQDGQTIFRGRMTEDTKDFDNIKVVDLEGALAYFNDSIIRPFVFPDDFENDAAYKSAVATGNVIEYFLGWLIQQHNSQVQEFQRFKLGNVTVTDPNNYLSRSSTGLPKTWEVLKTKLFNSDLGGYLCIRYEEDGNYIDYLPDFELTNTQRIEYGENLLDIATESDATSICTAIIPQGAKLNEIDQASDDDSRLSIAGLPDGDVTEDIVKTGDTLYSKSGVEEFGWIYAAEKDTTWEDVTIAENLQTRGVEFFGNSLKYTNTVTITAVDLHISDEDIAAFRIYRYIIVNSKPHEHEGKYKLTKLDIDLLQPQNTKITLGDTKQSMTDINRGNRQDITEEVKAIKTQATTQSVDLTEIQHTVVEQTTAIVNTCEEMILSAMQTFVETSNYESFTETVQAQMKIMADEISLNFTTLTDSIKNVDGDLQEKYNTITKYFAFDVDGLTIGQADNPYKVVIDNDRYSMKVNDVEVLWLDAEGKAHIPELDVTRKFNLFGYLIDRDEDGNINCEYMGGES